MLSERVPSTYGNESDRISGMEKVLESVRTVLELHGVQGLLLTLLGVATGWLLARWRRFRMQRRIAGGDAREIIAIDQILVHDYPDGRTTVRNRACGSAALESVLPNPVAHDAFLARAKATRSVNPLIDLKDHMGSYLLYLLTPWVCGMVRHGRLPHEVWIMAPVCEPGVLSAHQSSTVILIQRSDLERFRDWEFCRNVEVEHGSDGARVLTLWHMAREYERQRNEVEQLQAAGKPTTFVETMYYLDLGLDIDEVDIPTKPVPWERFASTLKALKLSP